MNISPEISAHIVDLIFALITFFAGLGYRNVSKRLEAERIKNNAIAEGVQCLLLEEIVRSYNKYQDKGYCPIYAKESIKKTYKAYDALHGNDVASGLYHKLLDMPEEKKEEEE